MRYTQKRNGQNVIPLLNVVCGVDMPKWSIIKVSDNEMYLAGDAVDLLAEFEAEEEAASMVEFGQTVCVEYQFRGQHYIGKFTVNAVYRRVKYGGQMRSFVRLVPVYGWDLHRIEQRESVSYLDVGLKVLPDLIRTEEQWVEAMQKDAASRHSAENNHSI